MDMVTNTLKQRTGFKSFVYRSGYVYNFVNQRAYEFKKKFKSIATIACHNGTKKVLDLPCGTGYLTRYLNRNVIYEGWDLNQKFLTKIKKDFRAGRVPVKKVILQQKNIFDFENYPKDVDTIVFCDILHHVYPNHMELVENAKNHAKKIIICEPVAVHPENMQVKDFLARSMIFITKHFPKRFMKYIDFFLADNDGINKYEDRTSWPYDRLGLDEFYTSLGISKIYPIGDETIGVWEK